MRSSVYSSIVGILLAGFLAACSPAPALPAKAVATAATPTLPPCPSPSTAAIATASAVEIDSLSEIFEHQLGPQPIVTVPWHAASEIPEQMGGFSWIVRLDVDEAGCVVTMWS